MFNILETEPAQTLIFLAQISTNEWYIFIQVLQTWGAHIKQLFNQIANIQTVIQSSILSQQLANHKHPVRLAYKTVISGIASATIVPLQTSDLI